MAAAAGGMGFQSGFVISPRAMPPATLVHHQGCTRFVATDGPAACKIGVAVKFGFEDQPGWPCAKNSAPAKLNDKRSYSFRCGNSLRECQSPITRAASQNVKKEKVTDREEINVESHGRLLLKESNIEESDAQDILASRTRVSSLRGWSNGGSAHSEIKYSDNTKHWKKLLSTSAFFSKKSFRELGCNDDIIESLRSQLIQKPSNIQALAFPFIISGKSCIVADQSGSGKTLAYLLPVIQRLKQEELQGLGKSLPQSPRVVILVPTAELACQVLTNCRAISKSGVPFRSMVATGGFRQRTQLESLQQDIDVLIVTPGRLMFLMRAGLLHLNNLRCVVLDEVDILFTDEDYDPALQILISTSPVTTQYLFVTATLPMDIYNKLVEVFPDCEVIMGPGVHRTSPNLEEILVDCSGDEGTERSPDAAFSNKKSALLQLVEEESPKKMIIFCNKIETCRKVENVLKRLDRKGTHKTVFSFHAALAQEVRVANMKEFCSCELKDKSLFLVCTDRASRGIDFSEVGQIVLFDFPRDPSEYVRRVGRTARGPGGKGKAFIFVVGKQVSLARRIIERNRRGHPLHDVPTAFR